MRRPRRFFFRIAVLVVLVIAAAWYARDRARKESPPGMPGWRCTNFGKPGRNDCVKVSVGGRLALARPRG